MVINGKMIDEFRLDFNKVMEGLQEKYDITISLGSISYWENGFTSKLIVNNGRDPEEIARREFDDNVWKFSHIGLEKGMYRRVFLGPTGERFAILGFNSNAKKYPLKIFRISDQSYRKAGEHFIKEILNEYYVDNYAEYLDNDISEE